MATRTNLGSKVESLWKLYSKTKNPIVKEKLMIHYMDYVKGIVRKMNLPYIGVLLTEDDLVEIGMIGLSEAIDKFQPSLGVKFETYAFQRIRGVIIDELRKLDNLPRSARDKLDRIERARQKIENRVGDHADPYMIAEEANISIEEYNQLKMREMNSREVSLYSHASGEFELEDMIPSEDKGPEEDLLEKEMKELIIQEIEKLPEKKKLVIVLYYFEGLTFKEIAEILRMSESRVSQIHSTVMSVLREKIKSKFA